MLEKVWFVSFNEGGERVNFEFAVIESHLKREANTDIFVYLKRRKNRVVKEVESFFF